MTIRQLLTFAIIAASFAFIGTAAAHTPLFACFDNGDGTIFCEGGFSDGSTAAGVPIVIKDGSGAVILRAELNRNSEIEFQKPETVYSVLFYGGEGHEIEIPGEQIFE